MGLAHWGLGSFKTCNLPSPSLGLAIDKRKLMTHATHAMQALRLQAPASRREEQYEVDGLDAYAVRAMPDAAA